MFQEEFGPQTLNLARHCVLVGPPFFLHLHHPTCMGPLHTLHHSLQIAMSMVVVVQAYHATPKKPKGTAVLRVRRAGEVTRNVLGSRRRGHKTLQNRRPVDGGYALPWRHAEGSCSPRHRQLLHLPRPRDCKLPSSAGLAPGVCLDGKGAAPAKGGQECFPPPWERRPGEAVGLRAYVVL